MLVHKDEPAWQNQNSGPGSSSTAIPSKVLSDLTSQMPSLQYLREAKGLSLFQYLSSGEKDLGLDSGFCPLSPAGDLGC